MIKKILKSQVVQDILARLKSPVLWLALLGLVYSTVIQPSYPNLPDWTRVVGYITAIVGIGNNPADLSKF